MTQEWVQPVNEVHEISTFKGQVDLFQYSGTQYQPNSDPDNPVPIKAKLPSHRVIENAEG
jgi:hypothetical protein